MTSTFECIRDLLGRSTRNDVRFPRPRYEYYHIAIIGAARCLGLMPSERSMRLPRIWTPQTGHIQDCLVFVWQLWEPPIQAFIIVGQIV